METLRSRLDIELMNRKYISEIFKNWGIFPLHYIVFRCTVQRFEIFIDYASGFPGSSLGKESAFNAGDPDSTPGLGRSTGEVIGYPLQYSWPSPSGSAGKESASNAGDLGSIPGLGRSPGEGNVFWPGEFHRLYSAWGCRVIL